MCGNARDAAATVRGGVSVAAMPATDPCGDDGGSPCSGSAGMDCHRRRADPGCARCAVLLARRSADDLERLVRDHQEALLRHARRLVDDPETARDLVQEAFLRLIERGPGGAPLCAWLHRVVRNLAIDHLRRRRRSDDTALADLAAPDTEEGDGDEIAVRVHAVLATLPPRQAALLRRALIDGTPPAALAREQGVPEGTMRWRLFMARARFRHAWTAERT